MTLGHNLDVALAERLASAASDEMLSVVATLHQPEQRHFDQRRPGEFPTRQAYRQALIDERRKMMAPVIANLRRVAGEVNVTIIGGNLLASVGLRGSSKALIQVLSLPEIKHAMLDQQLVSMSVRHLHLIDRTVRSLPVGKLAFAEELRERGLVQLLDKVLGKR